MSQAVELPASPADELEERDEVPPVDRRRLVGGIACVALLVVIYILLLRASGRAVLLVDDIQNRAPKIFFALALAVAAGSWIAPAGLRETVSRLSRNVVVGPVLLAGAIGLCITPALVSWLDAGWAYSKIAGVLPWSDAKDYHVGGLRLLNTGELDAFTMRRPLNAGFYAVRMAVTGQSFWATMLIQGALVGAAGFLVVRVIVARVGVAAGLVVAAVLFTFIHPLIDLTLSESLGLALGSLALAALWEGVAAERPRLFALGLLMLTVALNVRAGPYFILPMLLIWVVVDNFHARRLAWKPVARAVAAVLVGFLLNLQMNAMYGDGSASMNSNFSYTLYGLAHGGTGWTSAQQEFPRSDYPTDAALTDAVYDAAFDEIRDHPGNLVRGIRKAYDNYFDQGIYGFAPSPLSGGLVLTMLVGLIALAVRGPTRRLGTMVLAAWVGIMLSVPFIFEDGGFRVMAAAVPILAVPPAVGLAVLTRDGLARWRGTRDDPALDDVPDRRVVAIGSICAGMLVVLAAGPSIAIALHDSPDVPDLDCAAGAYPVVAEVGPQIAHITVVARGVEPRNFGEMTYEQFHADPSYGAIEIGPAFAEIAAGSVILAVYNLVPGSSVDNSALVVAPADELPHTRRVVALCGRPSANAVAAGYGLVFTDRFEDVNQ